MTTALRNVAAIVEKEWRHYFGSPIAWVALFVWTLIFGVFFSFRFGFFLDQSVNPRSMQFGAKLSLNELVFRGVFENSAVVILLVAPLITMRLLAEEKRQGTLELLATSPLTNLQIVLGKFLAASALYALMILSSLVNVVLVFVYASVRPEWKPVATAALGLWLFGSCFIALGLFVSSRTQNQIVAAILSFCLFMVFWTFGWLEDPMGGAVKKAIAYLGVTAHMEDMMKGVLDFKDLVFYVSFIAFGIFLSYQSVESQRWRA